MIPPWLFSCCFPLNLCFDVQSFVPKFSIFHRCFVLAMFLIVRLAKNWKTPFFKHIFVFFQVKVTSISFLDTSPYATSLEHSLCIFRLPSLHRPPSKNSFHSSRRPFPFNYDISYAQDTKAIKFSNFVSPTPPPYLPNTSQKSNIYYDT